MIRIGEVKRIWLGYQNENGIRKFQVDANEWLDQFPGAEIIILHKRSGDEEFYDVQAHLDEDSGILSWTVQNHDTEIPGSGVAVFAMSYNGCNKLSQDVPTYVSESAAASYFAQRS